MCHFTAQIDLYSVWMGEIFETGVLWRDNLDVGRPKGPIRLGWL